MTLLSLLYVSRSTIDGAVADAVVTTIVETARRVNQQKALTGALIFTGANFAQILEGPGDAVDALMASISVDPRHTDVEIVDRSAILERHFDQWSMAYFGRVRFVERHITALLDNPYSASRAHSLKLLRTLIYEFARR